MTNCCEKTLEDIKKAGIINGTDGNRLDPQGTATRAQAAAMLCRFLAK